LLPLPTDLTIIFPYPLEKLCLRLSVLETAACISLSQEGLFSLILLRLNLVVPDFNLIDPGSLTITGKEKCRQKLGLQLAA